MASPELSRHVEKVVGCPPLRDMDDFQRREFHEALLDVHAFEDLPGKWQAAIMKGRAEPTEAAGRRQRVSRSSGKRARVEIPDPPQIEGRAAPGPSARRPPPLRILLAAIG